ncbi:MAG: adenylate/guanylate cyclase domain-containing protein [Alphaproteobacteria bacterium]|nr:adenylate/guanylate cyclase domain-containing protein [Alphaproteobacteria bacterium]
MQRRLTAILHADIVGYSRLMESAESATIDRVRSDIHQFWGPLIATHRGRLVNVAGDALLVIFDSIIDAAGCAIAVQSRRGGGGDATMRGAIVWRIGINLADVSFSDTDVFGIGVNLAERLQALAEPGGICVSRPVWDALPADARNSFQSAGMQAVKNFAQPVHIFHWVPAGTEVNTSGPTRSSQRRRVVLEGQDPASRRYRLSLATEMLDRPEGIVIGRQSGGCDVVVSHESVSRRHARLTRDGVVLFIEDLGSTNGTLINGIQQAAGRKAPVLVGKTLSLGDVIFEVRLEVGEG